MNRILTLRINTLWQVAMAHTLPKPAKEYLCPNTHGQNKLRWVTMYIVYGGLSAKYEHFNIIITSM